MRYSNKKIICLFKLKILFVAFIIFSFSKKVSANTPEIKIDSSIKSVRSNLYTKTQGEEKLIYTAEYYNMQSKQSCQINDFIASCDLPYIEIKMELILSDKLYSEVILDTSQCRFCQTQGTTSVIDKSISISGKNIPVIPESIYFQKDYAYISSWKNSEKISIKLKLDDLKKLLDDNYIDIKVFDDLYVLPWQAIQDLKLFHDAVSKTHKSEYLVKPNRSSPFSN
jgi:hypothetical protein